LSISSRQDIQEIEITFPYIPRCTDKNTQKHNR